MARKIAPVELARAAGPRWDEVLTPEALRFLAALEREFGPRRKLLLDKRAQRQAEIDAGRLPEFLPETRAIREGDWQVAPVTNKDFQRRRVEITGPAERKMIINAMNCGADVFMADFEDAFTPTWGNLIEGQIALRDAFAGTIAYTSPEGREYRLNDEVATLVVRPRGWHLTEKHATLEGEPISAGLFDFGLCFFHNARRLLEKGSGPYFYLPKMESHKEARLWNDVFAFSEDAIGIPRGSIKATVLIETILAAFEMDEILYELRGHIAGLNAGRWDYIFSVIKKLGKRREFLLPDRSQVTMAVPFMRAYTELMVKTCHRRGAHAIGGMAAFIPNRKNAEVTEAALAKVREDKLRESRAGCDGTWVAHPDLVAVAMEVFQGQLGRRPHQKERQRDDVRVEAKDLLDVRVPGGSITAAGVHQNIGVGIRYIESWLRGVGAAAIFDLMEDTATAEISRSQLWQWIYHGVELPDGQKITRDLVRGAARRELAKIKETIGADAYQRSEFDRAAELFERVALSREFVEFLTFPAYEAMEHRGSSAENAPQSMEHAPQGIDQDSRLADRS